MASREIGNFGDVDRTELVLQMADKVVESCVDLSHEGCESVANLLEMYATALRKPEAPENIRESLRDIEVGVKEQ
jgi:hypothetical protein